MDIFVGLIVSIILICLVLGDLVFNFLTFALKVIIAVGLCFLGFFLLISLLSIFTPLACIVGVVAFLLGIIWFSKLIFKDARK